MFDRAGVEYESVDLNQDNDSLIYVKEVLGYSAAPVVVAGEKVWSGFRMSEIKNTIAEIDLEKGQEAK